MSSRSTPHVLGLAVLIACAAVWFWIPQPAAASHFAWDQGHDTFTPEGSPPPDENRPTCNPNGSPFEVSTGSFFYTFEDLSVRSVGLDLRFTRKYQSADKRSGPIGRGWTHTYDIRLMDLNDGVTLSALCRKGDGKRHRFLKQPDGSYLPPPAFPAELTKTVDGFVLREQTGATKHFDNEGLLTKIQNRNGKEILLSYDETGFLVSITAASGQSVTLLKGPNGKVASVTDPLGRTFIYDYDGNGNLIRLTNPLGEETNYYYTVDSLLEEITDSLGRVAQSLIYDTEHRVTSYIENGAVWTVTHAPEDREVVKTDAAGNAWTIHYNENGNVTERIDPLGGLRSFTYDSSYRLTSQTNEAGGTVAYEYDEDGRLLRIVNAAGEESLFGFAEGVDDFETWTDTTGGQTSYQYDQVGNLTQATDPAGNSESFAYDLDGQIEKTTDPNGAETAFEYDAFGQVAKIIQPDGSEIIASHDAVGNLLSVQDADGLVWSLTYDDLDRVASVTTPGGEISSYVYAPTCVVCGGSTRLESETSPAGTMSWFYDAFGRQESAIDRLGGETTQAYDARGNLQSMTQPGPAVTTYAYDAAGRLSSVAKPAGSTSLFEYDAAGRSTALVDPIGVRTNLVLDAAGRVTQVTSPDTGGTTYTYDPKGLLVGRSDGRSETATYGYDPQARLLASSYSDATRNITAAYDSSTVDYGKGRLTHLIHDGSEFVLHENVLGFISKRELKRQGDVYPVEWEFSSAGRAASIDYPSGLSVSYGLDASGRINSVDVTESGTTTPVASSIGYDAVGRMIGMTLGNGLVESRGYDAKGRLTSSDVTGLLERRYTYDGRDNVLTINDLLDASAAQSFTYDIQDRLLTAGGPWGQLQYVLDANGNRLARTLGTDTVTYTYSGNRLSQTSGSTTVSYLHDASGNTTSIGTTDLEYGSDGRLLRVVRDGGELARYAYNGLGQRVEKITPAQTTLYHYDWRGRLLEETDSAGNAIVSYIYLNDWRPIASARNGIVYYYHVDSRNVPLRMTDGAASVVWSAEWSPYGDVFGETGTQPQSLRFPGQYFDEETGLVYNWYRYYDSTTGRYLQPEPLGPQGTFDRWLNYGGGRQVESAGLELNVYGYAQTNPLAYYDPTGLDPRRYGPWGAPSCIADAVRDGRFHGRPKENGGQGGGHGYRWAHCWTSCKIANDCGGGPWVARKAGKAKEIYDLLKCFQEPPTGPHCYSAFQPSDDDDNETGIACPPTVTCDQRCKDLEGEPDGAPGPYYNIPVHPNQPRP